MRIIIVGIGKVGKVLAEYLSQEGHDLVIIDTDAKLVEDSANVFDVKGVIGNGASYDTQMEAEADKTDLLIAVTNSDELNILCCLVGKKNGVKHTIARVRDPEYSKSVDFMHNELGLSMIVNPELEAAKEIFRMLSNPSSSKVDYFANDQAEIAEVKVMPKSLLAGKPLSQVRSQIDIRFLVSAVERKGKVHIPGGQFVLEAGDKIFLTSSPGELEKLFRKLGTYKHRSKHVMIIGGGKITYYVAEQLISAGISVKIIEIDPERCHDLAVLLPEATVINTDGSNQENLFEEGIKNMDAVVTLTGFDEENIVISLFAESIKVPKVITKINHYSYTSILESVGLDSMISPKENTAYQILRFVRSLTNTLSQVRTLYKFLNNQIEATEFYIPTNTSFTGIKLRDLPIKDNILISCIIRNDQVIIPSGEDSLEPLDSVVVVTTLPFLTDFKEILRRS
ncbi:MAG: Trk system potassium transporter TrkA [Candidatus Izemoplasmatales bacterium]|jgi:trk system potassium uptake protein TrkA|nr:Trk system potassium transporter TrkA [Candidatus Izemoplasmatales bacterium]MDD4355418.1 Trk system potassium transporter TrkA [Candidatus Izemoplasmatales bacterium]MDD4988128.1 Trk system potassium transporter TrkA [Candidatus Izemoplasmatales bacterium]MDY0373603.1 Trk system potassium transporter TrkA [Candidatus Izemoplasmatales bacterium]